MTDVMFAINDDQLQRLVAQVRTVSALPSTHPSDSELFDYAMGSIEDPELHAVANHIGVCDECSQKVDQAFRTDSAWNTQAGQSAVGSFRERLAALTKASAVTEDSDADNIEEYFETIGLFENEPIGLPNGLCSNVFVNPVVLASSGETVRRVATAFEELFADTNFDVVVTCGWAMRTIGLQIDRNLRAVGRRIVRAAIEGYDSPTFVSSPPTSGRALVLTDVSASGQLLRRVGALLIDRGLTLAGFGAVVKSELSPDLQVGVRAICARRLGVSAVSEVKPKRYFNPLEGGVSGRKAIPRSPSAFLEEDSEARLFWKLVDSAEAFRPHFAERKQHYLAFVDTNALLESAVARRIILDTLTQRMRGNDLHLASVWLAPKRPRAIVFARRLAAHVERLYGLRPNLLFAKISKNGDWIPTAIQATLVRESSVAIVDSAVAHGETLEVLSRTCDELGARHVGVVTIISRLTASNEAAVRARLGNGFVRFYQLPIRPVAVLKAERDLCPWCRTNDRLRFAATETRSEALGGLVKRLEDRHCQWAHQRPTTDIEQLSLPDVDAMSFLETCHRSTAVGVTLNAAYAVMHDGVAPLELPEVLNERIPPGKRAAMIENLTKGALDWGGRHLSETLNNVLSGDRIDNVWIAATSACVKASRSDWLLGLDVRLTSKPLILSGEQRELLARNVYDALKIDDEISAEFARKLGKLPTKGLPESNAGVIRELLQLIA